MEEKYINLLLKKCLNFDNSKSLLISYYKDNLDFVNNIVKKAKEMGIDDIYLDEEDIYEYHDLMENIEIDKMDNDSHFDKSVWDEYAKKNASFLMIDTEYPGMMEDIDSKKIAKATSLKRNSKPIYKEKQMRYEVPWTIAVMANKVWAESLFPDDENPLDKLQNIIYEICLVNEEDPFASWDKLIAENKKRVEYLESLNLKSLQFKNSLGTDLTVTLPEKVKWSGIGSDGNNLIVNMPSFEIFTSPNYLGTNGVVYSAKPLIYNGKEVNNFKIEFKDGKAIKVDAETGKEVLESIIKTGKNNCYLGEVALVDNDSPISNTNLIFGTTLFDENAACHLALGEAFCECLENGSELSEEQLQEKGLNVADNHVDFMIGTEDLEIIGTTYDKEEIVIFEKGNFKKNE